MTFIAFISDFFLHLDAHLLDLVVQYGTSTYLVLALVIFSETGLVFAPFLPGDSLLFASGAIGATGALDIWTLAAVILVSAILGDAVNYAIGSTSGKRLMAKERRLIKPSHIEKTQAFFAKHGGKAIVYARFVPIVRTFAPFVAGVAAMPYRKFAVFNVAGALVWTVSLLGAGYFFGQTEFVKTHFSEFIIGIVVVSLAPAVLSAFQAWVDDDDMSLVH
jgi:membrane-associated protein